jgi:hypothetical protein
MLTRRVPQDAAHRLADNATVHAATRVRFESIDRARRMVRRIGIFHPVNLGPRVGNRVVTGFLIYWRHIPLAKGTALSLLAHWSGMPEEC